MGTTPGSTPALARSMASTQRSAGSAHSVPNTEAFLTQQGQENDLCVADEKAEAFQIAEQLRTTKRMLIETTDDFFEAEAFEKEREVAAQLDPSKTSAPGASKPSSKNTPVRHKHRATAGGSSGSNSVPTIET